MLKVTLVSIVLVVVGVLAIRRPEIIARFIASGVRVSERGENLSKTEEMARTIREDGLEWRTKYPDFYNHIVATGYVAFGFCVILWLVYLMSVLTH